MSENSKAANVRTEHTLAVTEDALPCSTTAGLRAQGLTSKAQSGFCCGTDLALFVLRTPVQPSPQLSDKLGQVGDFDVEVTDVDVPRNLRQIDVFHSRHSPGGGC